MALKFNWNWQIIHRVPNTSPVNTPSHVKRKKYILAMCQTYTCNYTCLSTSNPYQILPDFNLYWKSTRKRKNNNKLASLCFPRFTTTTTTTIFVTPNNPAVAQEASLDVFGSRLPMRWWQAAIHRLAELTGDHAVPLEENRSFPSSGGVGCWNQFHTGWLCFWVFLDGCKWIS